MLLKIFLTFFKIGAFTFGGGYAMLPVIQKEVVDRHNWLKDEEFMDSISVTNSLPGPLAINCATFVGYRKAGIPGAVSAVLGAVMPSFLIILLIAMFFSNFGSNKVMELIFAGVRPAVVALILYALIKLSKAAGINKFNLIIAVLALASVLLINFHPIMVILMSGIAGLILFGRRAQ